MVKCGNDPSQVAATAAGESSFCSGGATVPGWVRILPPLLLIAAGWAAYATSLDGAFLFDDELHILKKPSMHRLWPPWELLGSRRPVVNYTLAANMVSGGGNPLGFHVVNVTVHVLAALTLFGIVHRTLRLPVMRDRFGGCARWLAFAAAIVWLLHPLNTQAVSYIVQRCESMMGLFYLLTLYCVIRGSQSPRSISWYVAAVAACALGMGSKAVMVTAPILVLLYDRVFLSAGFKAALRARWPLYLGLAGTWAVLFGLGIVQTVLNPRPTAAHVGLGFKGISPVSYAFTQPEILVHYVRLSLWPAGLCLDYDWPALSPGDAMRHPGFWAAVILVLAALGKTGWDVFRNQPSGFVGAWFFLILGPTSSFLPIKDPAFEHRMYLPLIAIVVLVVMAGYAAIRWLASRGGWAPPRQRVAAAALLFLCAGALGFTTARRNLLYQSPLDIWEDTCDKRPDNARAHLGVGTALYKEGRFAEAVEAFREAVRIRHLYSDAHFNLAIALRAVKRFDEAVREYREAIRVNHLRTEYYVGLVQTLIEAGRPEEAVDVIVTSAKLEASRESLLDELAQSVYETGNWPATVRVLRRVLGIDPSRVSAWVNLGHALRTLGRIDEAVDAYNRAVTLAPGVAANYVHFANALGQQERLEEAVEALEEAVALDPESAEAHFSLGWAHKSLGRVDLARQHFQRTLAIDPDHANAKLSLAALDKP